MTALPAKARAVIIGGGVSGCSVAYHLAKLGWSDIVLLERKQLTSGTTWHAAGLIGQLRASQNMTRLAKYSADLYTKLEAETGVATGMRQVGSITVALTEERKEEIYRQASLARAFDLWAATMEELSGHHSYKEALGDGDPVSGLAEALRYPLGRSHHILPALVVLWLERGLGLLPASRRQRLLGELDRLRDSLESTLGDDGVLLYPPYPRTAPRHHHMMLRPLSFACTALFNALYFPVTQVPAGRAPNGMPLGVQVVGPRGADGRTLAVAEWLETDLGGWVRPTPA